MGKLHHCIMLVFVVLSNCFFGCATQKQHIFFNKITMPLCIKMPQANTIAQNIAPQLHQSLLRHFKHMGYYLTHTTSNAYTLCIKIIKFDSQQNYVSPDILLFHSLAILELEVSLLDTNNQILTKKTFSSSVLLSKPRNPILSSSFILTKIDKNLIQLSIRIEHHFRSYLALKK